MGSFAGYRCSICKKDYAPEEVTYTCPADGGNLDVILDYQAIKSKIQPGSFERGEPSLWRYLPLLPVEDPGGAGTPAACRRLDAALSAGSAGQTAGSEAVVGQG